MNRILCFNRSLSSSLRVAGQGKRWRGKFQARHQGNYPRIDHEVEMSPSEYNKTGHFVDHLKTRGNYQGYEHEHWQNRNVRTKLHLPFNSDFSQGELVQEKLVYDYAGTRKAPFTARAVPQKNRVPLIIAPPIKQLRNSPLKPYVSSRGQDRYQFQTTDNSSAMCEWENKFGHDEKWLEKQIGSLEERN